MTYFEIVTHNWTKQLFTLTLKSLCFSDGRDQMRFSLGHIYTFWKSTYLFEKLYFFLSFFFQ